MAHIVITLGGRADGRHVWPGNVGALGQWIAGERRRDGLSGDRVGGGVRSLVIGCLPAGG